MTYCLRKTNWTMDADQDELMNGYMDCLRKTFTFEQVYRAEMSRPRPGAPKITVRLD